MIKNTWNNFFNRDIQFVYEEGERLARFQHILKFWNLDQGSEIRFCPKLYPVHFEGKKEVILECQIFSHTASAAMEFCVKNELLDKEANDTTIFLKVVNDTRVRDCSNMRSRLKIHQKSVISYLNSI